MQRDIVSLEGAVYLLPTDFMSGCLEEALASETKEMVSQQGQSMVVKGDDVEVLCVVFTDLIYSSFFLRLSYPRPCP